nr:immunoglobulin heavy chain junction region [Mus musculus]
ISVQDGLRPMMVTTSLL